MIIIFFFKANHLAAILMILIINFGAQICVKFWYAMLMLLCKYKILSGE
jgi:hypothetical protein